MKKTNKIIALILAMVLAFSSVPLMASAAAIDDKVDTVEKLIQGESLGNLVEWLLKNINNRKEEILGSVLSLVFMFVEDEALQAKVGDTDLLAADDEALSKILVDWLNADILPGLQNDLASDDTVKAILKIVSIDISSVDNIIKTLYGLATTNGLGDISNLKEDSLVFEKKGLKTTLVTVANSGSKGVLYSVLQFLSDNTTLFKNVLSGKVKLGLLGALNGLINDLITDYISPDAIKEMLCDAIELDYEAYKTYTADEIVAVAFLKLLTGNATVSREEAAKVMDLSIYGLLETYAADIYANLLLDLLNNDAKTALADLVAKDTTGKLAAVINLDYEFKADSFNAYLGAGKGNMVAQLNNVVIALLEIIIKPEVLAEIGLEKGGNEKLNSNLTKAFQYVLPLIKDLPDLGVDLSGFTADKVKNMTAEEMAVAVLKLFFEGWFKNEDMAEVNKAKTLEQLAVLAAKYAVTYDEWVPMEIKAANNAKNVENMDEAACLDLVFEIGMEVAAKALAHNSGTTYFTLPEDTSAWTGNDYLDDIVDWALNFVDGLPASADGLSTERGKLDGEGGFFKLNVILDSLFDLSFIAGCGNDLFAFDFETMLLDKFLGNLLNFDIKAAVDMLAENEEASLFDKKVNKAVIDLVDDLLTGLFEETYTIPSAVVLGDVDADGEIKAGDARLALRASVDLEKLTDAQFKAADVDKDGIIKAGDARLILRASVGLETL